MRCSPSRVYASSSLPTAHAALTWAIVSDGSSCRFSPFIVTARWSVPGIHCLYVFLLLGGSGYSTGRTPSRDVRDRDLWEDEYYNPSSWSTRAIEDQLVLDIEVRETANGYEAVEASGARETSGNPYVAVVNLLDSMTEDDITFDVSFGGDSKEPLS